MLLRADLAYALPQDGTTTVQAHLDAGVSFGDYGLQFGATSTESNATAQAVRLILWRDLAQAWRVGLSVGQVWGEDPARGLSLGLHGLYRDAGLRIEAELIKPPDDQGTNGIIVATIRARQDIAPGWQLHGELYRRSTDTEEADLSAALLGIERDLGQSGFAFAEIYRSGADSRDFLHDGLRLGAGWRLESGLELQAAATLRSDGDDIDTGLNIGLRFDLGGADGLFQSGPIPDVISYGAY